jgi:aminopeptidase-like protein
VSALAQAPETNIGASMYELAERLYPICRSITGDGVRETLSILQQRIPLEMREVPSGLQAFDWTVPHEWNIRDAWILGPGGEKIVDFRKNNLHVVSYSIPVHQTLPLETLKQYLHTLPAQADLIPYRTSYYTPTWGFAMPHRQAEALPGGRYEVYIDSTLQPGALTWGELFLPGKQTDEVLFSCHVCHPSLANDNLSGIAVAAALAAELAGRPRRYSYRFLFIPGTIGAISWLYLHRKTAFNIRHGLVLTCVGDSGSFHYKRSRRGNADIDRAMELALKHSGQPYAILPFSPYGYDERQYCSPGFNLPVGCFMRSVHGTFPEYHTSADNLDFIRPENLAGSLQILRSAVDALESNETYVNENPWCEPQLGKRGLYASIGGANAERERMALLWVLNQSDAFHSLLDIAEVSGLSAAEIARAAELLSEKGLLRVRAGW